MVDNWLENCLERIKASRVAVVGDLCLDAYWFIDGGESEVSVEAGLAVRKVRTQRYSPGGAANVVANLGALGVAKVSAIGVIGQDLFGNELFRQLSALPADTRGIICNQPDWETYVFSKPHVGMKEQHRIDFGGFNKPTSLTIDNAARIMERAAQDHDVLVINQQIPHGVCSHPAMIEAVNDLARRHSELFVIVDSRDVAEFYNGVSLKMNAAEASRLLMGKALTVSTIRTLAQNLCDRMQRPVFITMAEHGIVVAHAGSIDHIPGIPVSSPIDSVGAGDTVVAAIAAVMAVDRGADAPVIASRFANLAAAVAIRKLYITGTASPEEIAALGRSSFAG
jgi:rfaE bifunctional protein kinase chain/domain